MEEEHEIDLGTYIVRLSSQLADISSRLKSSVELQADILAKLTDRESADILEEVNERRREYLLEEMDRFLKSMDFSQEYRDNIADELAHTTIRDKK